MENLNERAANYAAEKTNELLAKAIAQAYADGYRDGVKDRDEGIASSNSDNDIAFIDLGLPSGTMWAVNFLMEGNSISYLPYKDADLMNIPTKEQWDELWSSCQWKYDLDDSRELLKAYCVGPNGNVIEFEATGFIETTSIKQNYLVTFWIKECEGDNRMVNSVRIYFGGTYNRRRGLEEGVTNMFPGYKLPIFLVRNK